MERCWADDPTDRPAFPGQLSLPCCAVSHRAWLRSACLAATLPAVRRDHSGAASYGVRHQASPQLVTRGKMCVCVWGGGGGAVKGPQQLCFFYPWLQYAAVSQQRYEAPSLHRSRHALATQRSAADSAHKCGGDAVPVTIRSSALTLPTCGSTLVLIPASAQQGQHTHCLAGTRLAIRRPCCLWPAAGRCSWCRGVTPWLPEWDAVAEACCTLVPASLNLAEKRKLPLLILATRHKVQRDGSLAIVWRRR